MTDTVPADMDLRVLRALALGTAIPAVFVDGTMTIRWASESIEDVTGHPVAALVGAAALDLVHPDDLGPIVELVTAEIANPTAYGANGDPARTALNLVRFRHRDGTFHAYELAATNLLAHADIDGFLLMLRLASERYFLDQAYRDLAVGRPATQVLGSLVELLEHQVRGARVAITCEVGSTVPVIDDWLFDEMVANDVRSRPVGEEHVWRLPIVSGGEQLGHTTLIGRLPPETSRWTAVVIGRVHDQVALIVQRDRQSNALNLLAASDPLTGLDNRRTFFSRVDAAERSTDAASAAVLYLDLDGFKAINDEAGHLVGDAVLVIVSERIRHTVRTADSLARLGGDEFTLLLRRLATVDDVTTIAERLVTALSEPIEISGRRWSVGVSIGVAYAPTSTSAPLLLGVADDALRAAKRAGKGCYRLTTVVA